ncbi:hypothetical protein [Halorubrum sp. Atlit-28R]|uniref:hypothetical protein n=1 Tax=Halorubrum sp. Atlit-28R TaxID=2282129 RepID=UPI0011C47B9E|nr:hypothetical protein [Halorubrum sp. Atlit-28R]
MNISVQNRRQLAVAGTIYFGSVLIAGLPLMYAIYYFFTETAVLLNLNLGATFLWQALLAGIAFVIGIFVAGKIAEQVLRKISQAA